MNYNIIQPLIIMTGALPLVESKYFELGFAVLLLSVLLWFGRNAIKKDNDREKWFMQELKKRDEEVEKANERYHELHIELLNIYKTK